MFWVDRIVDEILKAYPDKDEFIVRDEKTLSGQVHVGSLRGVVIHGVVAEALAKRGKKVRFIFEFNDADPFDGLPAYLDRETYLPHMGKPLKDVPAPEARRYKGKTAKNLAEYYGFEFLEVIHALGFKPEITWGSELYKKGFYDEWIKIALAHPQEIRTIYKEVSGSDKEEEWMPLQIVCEKCGKVGSTTVVEFDGKLATYRCEKNKVTWAVGCEHEGKVAPWKGRGKLPWKMEWPVKWAAYKVDIEGSGKDHCSAGGSHDVAERICAEILKVAPPFNIPYEFFLLGGAKMSSSKGNASSAKAVSDLLPPELLRFLMIMKEPNQPIEFSPEGETIPRLYDRHDEAGEHYFLPEHKKTFPDLDRLFYFSQLNPEKITPCYFPRFSKLAFLSQIPSVDIAQAITHDKGATLTPTDKSELKERLHYIENWLGAHAPDSYKYTVMENEVPASSYELSSGQKIFLTSIATALKDKTLDGQAIHEKIHELVKASGLKPDEAFPAIYHALLGKSYGPKVGWFIEALDRKFIIERFEEVASLAEQVHEEVTPFVSDLLVVDGEVRKRFPELKSAWIELSDIHVGEHHPELTKLIDELVTSTDWEAIKKDSKTTPEIAKRYARLIGFKQLYKATGVDPTKRKPSPVALVDRLANGKPFPRINDLVDLYNYLVVKHQCSMGAFSTTLTAENGTGEKLNLPIILRFSEKGEKFQGIMDKEKPLDDGELCYFDSSRLCIARDFNYLDSELTKVSAGASSVLLNVDANEHVSHEEFEQVVNDLMKLAVHICGGTLGKKVIYYS